MSPRQKSIVSDILFFSGVAAVIYGLYRIDLSLACIVGGLAVLAASLLLEKR